MPNVTYSRPPDRAWYNPLRYLDNGWSQAPVNGGLGVGTPKLKAEDSALNQVIAPVASAVASNLDGMSGARAVRGLVGGKPREALSVLPASDELGFTAPEQNTSGKQIGQRIGLISPNDNLGTVKGMALDAVLNPKSIAGMGRIGVGLARAAQAPARRIGAMASTVPMQEVPEEAIQFADDLVKGVKDTAAQAEYKHGFNENHLKEFANHSGKLGPLIDRVADEALWNPRPEVHGLDMRLGQFRRRFPMYKENPASTVENPDFRVTGKANSPKDFTDGIAETIDYQSKPESGLLGYYNTNKQYAAAFRSPGARAKAYQRGMRGDDKVKVPFNDTVRHESAHGIMDQALRAGTGRQLPYVMQIPTALRRSNVPFLKGLGTFADEATAQALGSREFGDQLQRARGFFFNPDYAGRAHYIQQVSAISPTAEWLVNRLPYVAKPTTYAPAGGAALLAAIRNGGEVPNNGEY